MQRVEHIRDMIKLLQKELGVLERYQTYPFESRIRQIQSQVDQQRQSIKSEVELDRLFDRVSMLHNIYHYTHNEHKIGGLATGVAELIQQLLRNELAYRLENFWYDKNCDI